MNPLSYLIDRHEVLRTTFTVQDGCPVQIVHPKAPLVLELFDLADTADAHSAALAIFKEEASRPIDLGRLPILRYVAIKVAADEHLVLRSVHTLVADGSSWAIHATELAALYEARLRNMPPPVPREMPLQYADYTVWQRSVLKPDGAVYRGIIERWKRLLGETPPPVCLPWRRPERRPGREASEGVIRWCLDARTAERLDRLACDAGATHFIIRLAVFVALVADITGVRSIVIGTYFANRSRLATRSIMGVFTNLVPLVFPVDFDATFCRWLETVRNRLFETEGLADVPYENLCQQLRADGVEPPEVQIIFAKSSIHAGQRFANLSVSYRPALTQTMPWGVHDLH